MSIPEEKSRIPPSRSTRATPAAARASSVRLYALLALGLILASLAWAVRSSRWVREPILRSKDLPELEALVHSQPGDALARYYLGRSYFLNRRFSDARTAYDDAIHLDPNMPEAHLGLGSSLFELGELGAASNEFRQALKLDARLAPAEFMLGKIAWLQNNPKEALPHVKRATELDPHNDQAWYGLGICLIQTERRDAAIGAMQRAIASNGAKPQYHTALGELYVYFGRDEEARQEYERALQLDPNYGPSCALMGDYLVHHATENQSAYARAKLLLLKATRLQTYRPQDVYRDLGQLYIQERQYRQAIPALQASIRKDPRDERTYYALARAYRGLGDKKTADATLARFHFISQSQVRKDSLEVHLRFYPDDAAARLKLARIYLDLGMAAQAAQQYKLYLSKQPGAPDANIEQRLREQITAPATGSPHDFGF